MIDYDSLKKFIKENPGDNNAILGHIGELIVKEYIAENVVDFYHDCLVKFDVSLSEDKYDSEKDMTVYLEIDGEDPWITTVEVKTQMPFMIENAFTIKDSQYKKCSSVDKFMFVEIPNKQSDYKCKIYSCEDPANFKVRDVSNRKMYLYKRKDQKLLKTIDDPVIIELLNKYNETTWRQKR